MDSYITLLAFILLLTFIRRYFDYRKAKVKALSDEERNAEFATVLEELASMRETMADIMLALDDQYRLPPPSLKDARDE